MISILHIQTWLCITSHVASSHLDKFEGEMKEKYQLHCIHSLYMRSTPAQIAWQCLGIPIILEIYVML